MIIGTITLDSTKLKDNFRKPDIIREYSLSLIPKEFNHLQSVIDNQLYYVAISLRKLGISDYKALNETIRNLLNNVKVCGYVDELVEIQELRNVVNMNKVNLYLERL